MRLALLWNESIRVRSPFIISSCTVYISWLFRMSAKYVRNLGRTIGRVSVYKSAKKNNAAVFHSVKAARLGGFWIFYNGMLT